MKTLSMFLMAAALTFATAACNTIEGLGEDVEAAGSKLDREAEENRSY